MALLERLSKIATNRALRVLVLRIGGAEFVPEADTSVAARRAAQMRELCSRIESLKVPVLAALEGPVSGAALELALASHYRVALSTATLGWPELTFGLLPAAGGTQRLPRLVGLDGALRLLFDAQPISAHAAKSLGLVDEVLDGVTATVHGYAGSLATLSRGPRRTCDRRVDAATLSLELMGFWQTEARRCYPNRTVALAAIEAITAAARLPFADGLAVEERLAGQVAATLESRAAIHVFLAERRRERSGTNVTACGHMLERFARELQRLLLEGATPRRVDAILEGFGMARNACAALDLVPPSEKRARQDDPDTLSRLRALAAEQGVMPRNHTDAEILERSLYPLINEGLRGMDPQTDLRAADIDVAWCASHGFPRYRGGPMFHADTIGLPVLLGGIEKYRTMFGRAHWEPAPLLVRLVREGKRFADWSAQRA